LVIVIIAGLSYLFMGKCHTGIKLSFLFMFSFGDLLKVMSSCVVTCFHFFVTSGHYESFQAPFENSQTSPSKIAVSFYQGMFSYAGYNYLNYMFEEVKNPFV
jgi:amino acid transporter